MSNSAKPPQAVLDQIIGLYNQGELEQTVSLAESLAGQYPNTLLLYDILGAAYMGLKNTDKTIVSYQKALQLNPNHTDAYNNMGMALCDQGKFDEAVESYQKAVNLEPDFADAHYNLGNALKQTGELKQAIESYKASLAINPGDAEVLLNYGNALTNYGDFDHAIKIYAKALKVNPNFAAAQTNLDNAIEEKTEIDKNVADYARIAKLEISSAEIVSFTGALLKSKGYLDAAIDTYKQAIKIKPDYADAYYNMGIALKDKGELDAAIDSYKQATKIKPDYAEAHNRLLNTETLFIGKYTYGIEDSNVVWKGEAWTYDEQKIKPKLIVGKFCSIGVGSKFYLAPNHRHDWVTTYPFHVKRIHGNTFKGLPDKIIGYPQSNGNIVLGNDIWFGENVTVMSGITIGDGAVLAANSVVVNDIPPYSISGGNPAKHIKYRFSEKNRKKLLKIQWWNLEESKLDYLVPYAVSNDIDLFFKKYAELTDS